MKTLSQPDLKQEQLEWFTSWKKYSTHKEQNYKSYAYMENLLDFGRL